MRSIINVYVMRCDASLSTQHLLLLHLLGFLQGLRLGSLFLSFNFGSCLVNLLLVAFEDLHEDDVGAEYTYVQRQMTNRDNCLLSLEAYGFL